MREAIIIFLGIFLLAGCNKDLEISEEDIHQFEVKQTFDEKLDDDFTFRFVTEKEEYREGEEVVLYGELIYTGEENMTISHSSSFMLFSMEEKVRDYSLSTVVREIGIEKELEPMEGYRNYFTKQDVFDSELEEKEYQAFIDDFKNRDDFPPGYYVVTGVASFFDGREHREIEAEVDFKVLPEGK